MLVKLSIKKILTILVISRKVNVCLDFNEYNHADDNTVNSIQQMFAH